MCQLPRRQLTMKRVPRRAKSRCSWRQARRHFQADAPVSDLRDESHFNYINRWANLTTNSETYSLGNKTSRIVCFSDQKDSNVSGKRTWPWAGHRGQSVGSWLCGGKISQQSPGGRLLKLGTVKPGGAWDGGALEGPQREQEEVKRKRNPLQKQWVTGV